ncbi:hypothetical protein [Streptosporangium roseum]|uniref:hypothetical protein n=1 Tax=Streptosporangium roseum TaxID=2001 RepID=UPI00332C7FDD
MSHAGLRECAYRTKRFRRRSTPYTVIDVLGDLKREKSLASAVLLPPAVGRRYGLSAVPRVLVNTGLGAAEAPPPGSS